MHCGRVSGHQDGGDTARHPRELTIERRDRRVNNESRMTDGNGNPRMASDSLE